jgi:signal recognition particle GTPase
MHADKHEMSSPRVGPAATTLFLMVGLPGAGKTTVPESWPCRTTRCG